MVWWSIVVMELLIEDPVLPSESDLLGSSSIRDSSGVNLSPFSDFVPFFQFGKKSHMIGCDVRMDLLTESVPLTDNLFSTTTKWVT